MTRVCLCLAMLAGCGRISFDARPGDAGGDGTVDGAMQDGPLMFGTPEELTMLSSAGDEDDPTLTDDELEIYFESNRGGTADIYFASRADRMSPWSAPVAVAPLMSAGDEFCPKVSADGLTLYFSSSRPGGMGVGDFQVSARMNRAQPWGAPVAVVELSSPENDCSASVAPSGLEIVFHSKDIGFRDIFRATRGNAAAPWTGVAMIPELSTTADEAEGAFSGDLDMVISSTVGGDEDLYVVSRPSTTSPFGPLVPIDDVNGPAADGDAWMSPDRRRLYFASNRTGTYKLFVAER